MNEQVTINKRVIIEDINTTNVSTCLQIPVHFSIFDLKKYIENLFNFPCFVQNWIINKRLVRDEELILDLNVDEYFLYLNQINYKTSSLNDNNYNEPSLLIEESSSEIFLKSIEDEASHFILLKESN